MKSATYKKTDKGVVKISNKINELEVKSDLDRLMAVYDNLFKKINTGSNVVSFVKTKEYKDGLLDALQIAVVSLLNDKTYINHENIDGLLKQSFYNRTKNLMRNENTFDIFAKDFSEYCQNKDYGITQIYLKEMIADIKKILVRSQFEIFKLYHIKGYSMKKIAKKLEVETWDIQRAISIINNRIAGEKNILNFSCLFDLKYVAHFSGKKKRSHKRKVLKHQDYIDLSGQIHYMDIESYQEPEKFKAESIPINKGLSYPTKGYFEVKRNEFGLVNESKVEVYYVSTLAYTNSILSYPVKGYSAKEYRRKKYQRLYQRSMKYGDNPKTFELFKGHKSYLYADGIQGV